jgi:hydrophobe/amphiphile efflux-1 (HAE1) family protein
MNFSAWSIRNPIAPILLFFILMVLGWQSFKALPITRFPNIDFPLVLVSVGQPGAAPSELEAQVTKIIEDAVVGITGVKNITSTINDGASTTAIEFRMEIPSDQAIQDVKDAIDGVRGDLPGGVNEPFVTKLDIEGQAIMTFSVTAPNMTLEELSWFVDDEVKRAIQSRPGVGRISRFGGADREIRIELDPVRLDSYGITASAVNAQLRASNVNLGAGRAEIGAAEQSIRTLGDAASVDTLANTIISLPSGRFVRLSELGQVVDTYEELRSATKLDGNQVVTFAVYRAKGASEVSVAEQVNQGLDILRAQHPDVGIQMIDDTVFYTYGNYEAAIHTLLEGALLAVIVVFAFLRNWRATLITAVALPLSAVPTFWIMDLLGFSLNLVSFLAITLATGILVDDAIVEIENIARHIRMGKSPYRASIDAADEIGLAVIATTFTIIAVFVPVSFMGGIVGQYFMQFGLTVAIAVAFSLLVARLITPMMAAYLMSEKDANAGHSDGGDSFVMRGYLRLVTATTQGHVFGYLRTYYLTLVGAIGVLIVSVYFMLQIPGAFLPPEDVSRISISVELPPGTTLDQTDATTEAMRKAIEDIEGIRNIFIINGASPTGDLDLRNATLTILLEKLDHGLLLNLSEAFNTIPVLHYIIPDMQNNGRTISQAEVEAQVFERLKSVPDARVLKLNDRGERDLNYSILAGNEEDLNSAIALLEGALANDPLLANVSSKGAVPRPEIQVRPRPAEAARLGVTTASIAETLRVATIGDVDGALAKISLDGRQIPVRVRLGDQMREDLARIAALRVPTNTGASVPISAVADVIVGEGPATINRFNRERRATIGADLPLGVALGTAQARFTEIVEGNAEKGIAPIALPGTARLAPAGDAEVQGELFSSFGQAMILGLMLMLAVLILLFKSVIQPLTILLSLPLAIGGVAAALIITNASISMPVLIGILMLMGIVTKNAILLVDFVIEMRVRGMDRFAAVIEAGHKRAQPIVMTSIAMSAGMLPSAIGVGEGGAFRAPMATAVIGGIIVSTVLSLVVVPAFYLIMDDLSRTLGRLFAPFIGAKEVEPDTLSPEEMTAALTALRADQSRASAALAEASETLSQRLDAISGKSRSPKGVAAE